MNRKAGSVVDAPVDAGQRMEIDSYWDKRSVSYSQHSREELGGPCYEAWHGLLEAHVRSLRYGKAMQAEPPRVLDLGCGPGFFSIILARCGCSVCALDQNAYMLNEARANIEDVGLSGHVELLQGSACELPFDDASFDMVVMRNLSWMMMDLRAAYEEWLRVLVPGGKLLVFDAGWYRYLADPAVNEQRLHDISRHRITDWTDGTQASDEEERRCEDLAREIPTTYLIRPEWDRFALRDLGVSRLSIDSDIGEVVFTESEKAFYRSSPFFMIEAEK